MIENLKRDKTPGERVAIDIGLTLGIIIIAAFICHGLHGEVNGMTNSSMIFVLAVLIISRVTDGYIYGILASIIGVLVVNYAFTYPYLKFNMKISGYPLTFFTLLVTSIIISMLTSRIIKQEEYRVAAEKERMRADLLRSISHDLRTPLTSISGILAVLEESGEKLAPEYQRELLADANEEAKWLICMVENLLTITRVSSQDTEIMKCTEAIEEIFEVVARKFRKRFPDIELILKVPDELLLVPMDAMLISQVLMNLLENSVNHGKTTTRIIMSAEVVGDDVRITVEDNGQDINRSKLPHIFDGELERDTGILSKQKHNMGIGLTVCAAIVKAHKGSITAANGQQGAVVSFTLPLQDVQAIDVQE
ncbi:MAG: DUF4118 domain-containing protein [Oscillospiraceae bacterium]|nr:DUF4118 domain-containing protein [Oscillospiraceae bacterium]